MKFACMSCGAKYSVPDGRLQAAGPAGLRVRCSRCRAIMVVAEQQRALHQPESSDRNLKLSAREDDETRKELRFQKKRASISNPSGEHLAVAADSFQMMSPDSLPPSAAPGVPAALSQSGVFRPLPGVHRQVTGLFFPELEQLKAEGKSTSSRVWYAAIDNRPRGPFSATEMIALADKGKVRDSTLVWRPGFATWKKIKHGEAGTSEDLSWLRKIVLSRKLREMEAQEKAQARLGIQPVMLTRTSSGGKKPTYQGGAAGMPPPLPMDEVETAADGDDVAGRITPVTPLLPDGGALPMAQLLELSGQGWPSDEAPQRSSSSSDAVPFAWRADELPAVAGTRRKSSRTLTGLAVAAGVVAFALGFALAVRTDALERLAALFGQ